MKSLVLILAAILVISNAGVLQTFPTTLPENTFEIIGKAGQAITVDLVQYSTTNTLQILYYNSGLDLLGPGTPLTSETFYTVTVASNTAYIRIHNPNPLPSAVIYTATIKDSLSSAIIAQQTEIVVYYQGTYKNSVYYQYAKFFYAQFTSIQGGCKLKINKGQEDQYFYDYKYDIKNLRLGDKIGQQKIEGGNFDVTSRQIYAIVYVTNSSLLSPITTYSLLKDRNVEMIGNSKCFVGCNKPNMKINPTKPSGCECTQPNQKYNPITDTCDSSSVSASPVCGDGVINTCNQQCDFGTAGNGGAICSSTCTLVEDSGYACKYETIEGTKYSTCLPLCGDLIVSGNQQCDVRGPQCSQCQCTQGYKLSDVSDKCQSVCGDGILVKGQQCDFIPRPTGCSAQCILNSGYYLQFDGSGNAIGVQSICGDQIKVSGQDCDVESPGCVDCKILPGYQLVTTNQGVQVANTCGDGKLVCGEQCDLGMDVINGNLNTATSGCDNCLLETGYYASRTIEGGVEAICGDGLVVGDEQCQGQCPQCDNCKCGVGFIPKTPGPGCQNDCGDGLVVKGQQCDLGDSDRAGNNGVVGYGCNDNCILKQGYYLLDDGTVGPRCGDYIQISPEICDVKDIGCVDCKQAQGYNCFLKTSTKQAYCTNDCGDAIVVTGEQCDLGDTARSGRNGLAGSGCNTNCTLQAGYYPDYKQDGDLTQLAVKPICGDEIQVGAQQCDLADPGCLECKKIPEYIYTSTNGIVTQIVNNCGDGVIVCDEVCDLGSGSDGKSLNTVANGCDNCKTIVPGWYCSLNQEGTSQCRTVCGDSIYVPQKQQCDNGNQKGCPNCIVQNGWACYGKAGQTSVCYACGNAMKQPGQQCDTLPGKPGCVGCKVAVGYTCSGQKPSVCKKKLRGCGDGNVEAILGEQCDDDNDRGGDGCNPQCKIEAGYTCSGIPSICNKIVPDTEEDTSNSISTQNDNDQSVSSNDARR